MVVDAGAGPQSAETRAVVDSDTHPSRVLHIEGVKEHDEARTVGTGQSSDAVLTDAV